MSSKFYNTIHASGQTLIKFNNDAESQNNIILSIFELNKNSSFTPFEVQKCLIKLGKDYPITSIRRAITTLTEEGKLVKLSEMKPGNYGKPNYTWKLEADKEIINNVSLYGVSNTEGAVCETCLHYPRNLMNTTCAECDDGDNWEAN